MAKPGLKDPTDGAEVTVKATCDRRSEPGAARLVRLLQAGSSPQLRYCRWLRPAAAACVLAQAAQTPGARYLPCRSSTLVQCLLREGRAVRASHGLAISETVPMRKPPTGEPYAGKPPVRFGGRGGREPIPTPIGRASLNSLVNRRLGPRSISSAPHAPRPELALPRLDQRHQRVVDRRRLAHRASLSRDGAVDDVDL